MVLVVQYMHRYKNKAVLGLNIFHYFLESGVRADREAKTVNPILVVLRNMYSAFVLKSAAIVRVRAEDQDNNFTDFSRSGVNL